MQLAVRTLCTSSVAIVLQHVDLLVRWHAIIYTLDRNQCVTRNTVDSDYFRNLHAKKKIMFPKHEMTAGRLTVIAANEAWRFPAHNV